MNATTFKSLFAQSELEAVKKDAASSEGKTAEERIAMFVDLLKTVEAMQSHLTEEERARRRQIADQLEPRPDPWWHNFRKEALEEYAMIHDVDQKELDRLIAESAAR